MGIFDKIKGVGSEMANLKNAGMDKVKGTLKDFEESLPIINKAGFQLAELNVGVGIPPSIIACFTIKEVSSEILQEAQAEIESKKIGKLVLDSLIGATKMKEKLELKNMAMKGIEVEIGLLPKVTLVYS
jgi:hypothetical protein